MQFFPAVLRSSLTSYSILAVFFALLWQSPVFSESDCQFSHAAGSSSEQPVYDVVIVGAGPAGISALIELKLLGYENILLVEKGPTHNMMIRNRYDQGKPVDVQYSRATTEVRGSLVFTDTTKEPFLKWMDEVIADHTSNISYGVDPWIKKNGEVFELTARGKPEIRAKKVVLAIGKMANPNQPSFYNDIPLNIRESRIGNDLQKLKKKDREGKEVLVVGGGDSAVEYAMKLADDGAKVVLSYRKNEFSRINEKNAKNLADYERDGKLTIRRETNLKGVSDSEGRARAEFVEGGDTNFDHIVFALGGSSPKEFLESMGIETEKGKPILTDYQTSVPGLYIAGELGLPPGQGSIRSAFNTGYDVAQILHRQSKEAP